MSEAVRIRLILVKHTDDTEPTVIGCMDETIWEHIDEEAEAKWRREAKRFFGDPPGYEYREAWASFAPDDLRRVFDSPVIQGTVGLEGTEA